MNSPRQPQLPFDIPPTPVVETLAEYLQAGGPQTILDIGCHVGRSSLYLARRGHNLVGVDMDMEALREARERQQALGAISCMFVQADARTLPVRKSFDAVLLNEVLQDMSKYDSQRVLAGARALTEPGGLNAVSGYVVGSEAHKIRNPERKFAPNELLRTYELAGWRIFDYHEDREEYTYFNNQWRPKSLARIIAQRPW